MAEPKRRGLLVDYGGVLTTNLFASFQTFCEQEGLDPQMVGRAFADDPEARRALVDFECGRLEDEAFEALLAERLGVEPEHLIRRLFGNMDPEHDVIGAVEAARAAGIRTGLLSNSWGRDGYDRTRWPELFHITVISGEVGMRKPDPRIYALAAEQLGVPPEETVFVDDLPQNLEPAREAGMAVIHHVDSAQTIEQLEALFGIALR